MQKKNFFKSSPATVWHFYKMSNPFQIYLNLCFLHNHLLWLPSSPIPVGDESDCCKTSQHIVIFLLTFCLEKNKSVNCFLIVRGKKKKRNNLKVIECKSDESCKFALRMWLRGQSLDGVGWQSTATITDFETRGRCFAWCSCARFFHRITETIELYLCQFYADFIFMTYGG